VRVSLFLSKLLPVFAYPLGFALVLGLLAFLLSLSRFRTIASAILLVGLATLWVASTPTFAVWLTARLEAEYPPVAVDQLPVSDVAVVLGGAIGQDLPPRLTSDLGPASDRVLHAARIFRAGKAANILVAAGNLPWLPAERSEAALIRDLLIEFGVPEAAIVLETQSRNTRENAVNAAAIVGQRNWRTGLIVTSAVHMPRAVAVFRRAGLDFFPTATDVQAIHPFYNSPLDLLPDAEALAMSTVAIKEWLGLVVYRYRGWA
jgi:uncharacterized SAM-binding protein YcdF (DUF218 family)